MMKTLNDALPEEWYWAAKTASEHVAPPSGIEKIDNVNTWLNFPFSEVKPFFRLMAFALWQHGHPIEYLDGTGNWFATDPPAWCPGDVYRVLPKPEELVLPSIDWSHVTPGLKFLVQDEDGTARILDRAPIGAGATANGWSYMGCIVDATLYASFKPGKGDWRKLIVQRPEGV
ncbi:MAG: hypothetical protein PW999_07880 [Paraburkholderia tropica]|nr:hypothetical protein [Paraburkholderia tropica]